MQLQQSHSELQGGWPMPAKQSVLTVQKNLPISGFRKLNLWMWSWP